MLTKDEIISCILAPWYSSLIEFPEKYDKVRYKMSLKNNFELCDMFNKYTGLNFKVKMSNMFVNEL